MPETIRGMIARPPRDPHISWIDRIRRVARYFTHFFPNIFNLHFLLCSLQGGGRFCGQQIIQLLVSIACDTTQLGPKRGHIKMYTHELARVNNIYSRHNLLDQSRLLAACCCRECQSYTNINRPISFSIDSFNRINRFH